MDRLSAHLSVDEFIATQHRALLAAQEEAWRTNPAVQSNALRFAQTVFEPIRILLGGHPLTVSSGYRCPELNVEVGGQRGSHHVLGLAADFIPQEIPLVEAMCRIEEGRSLVTDLDLAILEFGRWIHVQAALTSARPRGSCLMTFDGRSYLAFNDTEARGRGVA